MARVSPHQRPEGLARAEFLRRTGALGIAGAAALGFVLPETRAAHAAPLPPVRDTIAAAGGAVIRIGHIEGFSGFNSAASESQSSGLLLAIEEANARNSRVRFEIVRGDDTNDPGVGVSEARRLIVNERVDVLAGLINTGVGLEVTKVAEAYGTFLLHIGSHGTPLTGSQASPVAFRTTCSNTMLANALGPALLRHGKRWFFLTADYAFGRDAQKRLTSILTRGNGRVAGAALHKVGETNFAPYVAAIEASRADVLVLCSDGADVQNASRAVVKAGLAKHMQIGGILLGNENAVGMETEALVGSLWGYPWGPGAGGARTQEIYEKLKARASGYPTNWRQYIGYIAGEQLCDRIAAAGTTDTGALVAAFEDHHFDAGKKNQSYWRRCDHQCVQDAYAGRIVPAKARHSAYEYLEIAEAIPGDDAAGSCDAPDARAAAKNIATHPVLHRPDYSAVSLR